MKNNFVLLENGIINLNHIKYIEKIVCDECDEYTLSFQLDNDCDTLDVEFDSRLELENTFDILVKKLVLIEECNNDSN